MKIKSVFLAAGAMALALACNRPPTTKTAAKPAGKAVLTEEVSVLIKTKTLVADTSVRVFAQIQTIGGYQAMTPEKLASEFIVNYAILPDYNSRDVLQRKNVKLAAQDIIQTEANVFVFSFDVSKLQLPTALMLLEINHIASGKKSLQDVPLRFTPSRLSDTYAVFDRTGRFPMVKNFASVLDTLQFMSLNRQNRTVTVVRYDQDFEPAPSPMGMAPRNVPRTLQTDSLFTISTNKPFTLNQPGLYFFQEDTTQGTGVSLRITDKRYPRYTRPADLVKPIIYISTKNELKELQTTLAPKKTLDNYWLRLTSNSETRAKRSIRAYYSRVMTANRLFTSYKEGWKTDMGMIYVVLGQPNQVSRLRDKEVWTYTQNANFSEINFTFLRKPNAFTEDYYELVRYVEYEPIWYPVVEEWRKGVVE